MSDTTKPTLRDQAIIREALTPLTRLITTAITETPVTLGTPQGSADLAATIAVRVAAYVAREVLPAPADRAAALRDRTALAAQFGEVLQRWGLLDEVNEPEAAKEFAVTDLLAVLPEQAAEPPLSPDYEHPECGFHWHGRDDMDIPLRDGQPVCPRCELAKVQKLLDHSLRRREEVGAECKRRGRINLERAERIIRLERELDDVRDQLGEEMLRADHAEAVLPAPVDRAADEDVERAVRRDGIRLLLHRLDCGKLTSTEAGLLRHHVEDEIREADAARRHAADRDRLARSEAEEQARADQAEAAIARVLTAMDNRPALGQVGTGKPLNAYEAGWRDHDQMVRTVLDGTE